jgi:hypothetical protein
MHAEAEILFEERGQEATTWANEGEDPPEIHEEVNEQFLQAGRQIRILSQTNMERTCTILEHTKDEILVHYDSFEKEYDEWLPKTSSRIKSTKLKEERLWDQTQALVLQLLGYDGPKSPRKRPPVPVGVFDEKLPIRPKVPGDRLPRRRIDVPCAPLDLLQAASHDPPDFSRPSPRGDDPRIGVRPSAKSPQGEDTSRIGDRIATKSPRGLPADWPEIPPRLQVQGAELASPAAAALLDNVTSPRTNPDLDLGSPTTSKATTSKAEPNEVIKEMVEVEYQITLQRKQGVPMGIGLSPADGPTGPKGKGLRIDEIHEAGAVAAWNKAHPNETVEVGHHMVEVNGARDYQKMTGFCRADPVLRIVLVKIVQRERSINKKQQPAESSSSSSSHLLPSGEWQRHKDGKLLGSCEVTNDSTTGQCEVVVDEMSIEVEREADGTISCDGALVTSATANEIVWSDGEVWRRPLRRILVLGGFSYTAINTWYIENPAENYQLFAHPTFWSEKGDYFLFYNKSMRFWAVEKGKRYKHVKSGKSMGIAHSQAGFDLSANTSEPWWEYDKERSQWLTRSGAGIKSRGSARPR